MSNTTTTTTRACAMILAASLWLVAGAAQADDGDPDPTFSGDGIAFADWAGGPVLETRVAVDAQGSVLVGGTITRTGNNRDFAIARLHGNGAIDTSFGFWGYRTAGFDLVEAGADTLMGIFPLADGKLMLLGRAEVEDEIVAAAHAAMMRLTAAGDVDTSFYGDGRIVYDPHLWPNATVYLRAVARQPDGKYLFGGYCVSCVGTYSAVVLRINVNGTRDASFGTSGWSAVPTPNTSDPRLGALHVDAQGRIVLGGTRSIGGGGRHALVVRLMPNGSADASFGVDGNGLSQPVLPAAAQAGWNVTSLASAGDGSLYLGVSNYGPINGGNLGGVARLAANGSLDTSYGTSGLRELTRENGSRIEAIALRSDGRLLAAGSIDHTGGGRDFYVARLLPGGGLDPDFDGNGVARYEITATQDDALAMTFASGKPVIAGHTYAADSSAAILRLQSDQIFANGLE